METAGEFSAMMKELSLLLTSMTLWFTLQTPEPEKWNTVERLCGRAEWSEEMALKGDPNSYNEKSKPIRRSEVRLYRREKDGVCCSAAYFHSRTETGKGGKFEFVDPLPGKYWIVTVAGEKEYPLAVTLTPKAETKDRVACSEFSYGVVEGKLELRRTITVD
jgi:hypothetical protein